MGEVELPKQINLNSDKKTLEAILISGDQLSNYEVKDFYEKMTHGDDSLPGAFWKVFRINKNGCFYEAICLFFQDKLNNSIKHDTTFLFPVKTNKKSYFLVRDNEELEATLLAAMLCQLKNRHLS
ncbi:hypothetical protein PCC7424_2926 [Gloeothece citriformis PCC 7424]|uniref:Uncharacterized protein n=1 Tax=Gloeothece citriformis (strain PCC 7424) TaxID=65393 RepID=B7K9X4_GLOC7|nr:hypothetical protein [Gloeothece citriformis]ACK71330.1 hypothetical protein PCC7424_2926 [Gloeothece citriformis PCC 7424]